MRGECLFTDRTEYCFICNKPSHGVHHLLFGKDRANADADGVFFPICDECHMLGHMDDKMGIGYAKDSRIHDNVMAEKLSKMLGETMWMLDQVADAEKRDELKIKFIKRYGRSYL